MPGGSPPLFRGNWADASTAVSGVGPLLASPVLHAAARSLFGGRLTATSFLYVNVTAPMSRESGLADPCNGPGPA
jgi:hypothetical protein